MQPNEGREAGAATPEAAAPTDEEWLAYFDSVRVSVRVGPTPYEAPTETTVYEAYEPLPWSSDLPANMLLKALPPDLRRPAYDLTDTRGHLSWGASGAFHQVVLFVSEHGADAAFAAGMAVVFNKLSQLLRSSLKRRPEPLDRPTAEARARHLIVEEFGLDADPQALDLREESRSPDDEEWTFVFEDAAARYDVSLKDQKPGVLASIRRTLR